MEILNKNALLFFDLRGFLVEKVLRMAARQKRSYAKIALKYRIWTMLRNSCAGLSKLCKTMKVFSRKFLSQG